MEVRLGGNMKDTKATQLRYTNLQGFHVMKDDPALRVLALDIASKCNFKCLYCFGEAESFKICSPPLTLHDYKVIMQQAKALGVQTIWLLGSHENTLSPIFINVIKEASDLGLYVIIFSNGAAFGDDRIARKIFNMTALEFTRNVAGFGNTAVVTKCDSLNREVQGKLAVYDNAHRQIQTAISNISQTSLWPYDQEFARYGINTVVTSLNYTEVGDIFSFTLANNILYLCDTLLCSGAAQAHIAKLFLSAEQEQQVFASMDAVLRKAGINNVSGKSLVNTYDQQCILFNNYIIINHDGSVVPCAGFPGETDRLGHVRDGLDKLWAKKLAMINCYGCASHDKCPCRVHLEDKTF